VLVNWLWLSTSLTLIAATYLGAMTTALLRFRRGSLIDVLEPRGRLMDADWLHAHLEAVMQAVALLRIAARLGFFMIMIVAMTGVGEGLQWSTLILAGVFSVVVLWLFTTVLANALARHAGVALIAFSMPLLRALHITFLPLTSAFAFVDEAVRRLTGARLLSDEQIAEADLLRSIEDTQREGALDETAAIMLENVVEFSSTTVGEIMIPRTDIEGVELTDDLAAIREFILHAGHSRIPVYRGNLDHIVGILYLKDLVKYLGEDAADFRLADLVRKPIVVPKSKPVSELLRDFQHSEVHLAIVIDEYGGTAGLVTIEDALEEIVGEIQDEHEPDDQPVPSLVAIDERRSEVDGRYRIVELNERKSLHLPEDDDFDTVAGFILSRLGRVPDPGESFQFDGVTFTILSAEPTQVQRIAIERVLPAAPVGPAPEASAK
jgi:CBS domain containing-hemolysin-like protein